jgi:hypothetical protein
VLTTTLAVIGVLAGLCGTALGFWALTRARTAVGECRTAVQRALPDTGLDLRAIRDVAVVRYDALEEMSGARSFSLAMLNAEGDGVVLTSINGRTESRTYAKIIECGGASEALSPEEYRAIRAARLGQGPGNVPAPDTTEDAPAVKPVGGATAPPPRRGDDEAGAADEAPEVPEAAT